MTNLKQIIEENEKEFEKRKALAKSKLKALSVKHGTVVDAEVFDNEFLNNIQLRLIEGFREMVDKDLEVVLEFVERYNKNDAEINVAQSVLNLQKINQELNIYE
jgi:hypothetical protein